MPCHWLAARGLDEAWGARLFRYAALLVFVVMLWVSVATRHWEAGFSTAFCTAWVLHVVTRVQLALAGPRRWYEDRRTGALELLLVTPVTAGELVAAHHHALRRAFQAPYFSLLTMNAVLLAMIALFPDQLRMRNGTWMIFAVFFTGGAVLTLADFPTFRWLALREGLRASTHLKAAGRTFAWIVVGPWVAFGAAFLLAVPRRAEEAALVFLVWVLAGLLYDLALIRHSRAWLRAGLRRRVSEGTGAVAGHDPGGNPLR